MELCKFSVLMFALYFVHSLYVVHADGEDSDQTADLRSYLIFPVFTCFHLFTQLHSYSIAGFQINRSK